MGNMATILKAAIVPVTVGLLAYKFGKGNLMKAAGAGIVGGAALQALRDFTGV